MEVGYILHLLGGKLMVHLTGHLLMQEMNHEIMLHKIIKSGVRAMGAKWAPGLSFFLIIGGQERDTVFTCKGGGRRHIVGHRVAIHVIVVGPGVIERFGPITTISVPGVILTMVQLAWHEVVVGPLDANRVERVHERLIQRMQVEQAFARRGGK